ncbi:ead/Ea22-like family protein [Serratia marcescens]|uniref:ead/Ea22-like family protein n=1 Tax=Serratia marcescens TaxID=615 RepID=UPI001F153DB5|nr:ead/Ea22-like family protein [Serratia marcescens]
MDKFSELKAAAMAATPGPWEWFTSNSMARLSSTPSGKDGDVLSAFRASDGVPCVSVSQHNMAFIAAANPAVTLTLLAELEAKDKRIAELERANQSQDDHINQQQDRIDSLEKTNTGLGQRLGAAEKRLATPVRLTDERTLWVGEDDYDTGHVKGWNANRIEQAALLKKQGFKVEGDE